MIVATLKTTFEDYQVNDIHGEVLGSVDKDKKPDRKIHLLFIFKSC
jgi:hypothetical protein